MARLKTPRAFNEFFNDKQDFREIQLWFATLSKTTPAATANLETVIITENTTMNSNISGITINASINAVTYTLATPGLYKGRTYRIDCEDDTNGAYVSGILNNLEQIFQLYEDESIIIQDNGTSWRVK